MYNAIIQRIVVMKSIKKFSRINLFELYQLLDMNSLALQQLHMIYPFYYYFVKLILSYP